MNITVRVIDSETARDSELLSYARRSVLFALSRSVGAATSVTIRLSDLNGPRGGTDKCCKIELRVAAFYAFTEATRSDARSAIDLSCARMARVVSKNRELARGSRQSERVAATKKGAAA